MKETLNRLNEIAAQLERTGKRITDTGELYRAELADRERRGITEPEEEIRHFNEWMRAAGREDLMIRR